MTHQPPHGYHNEGERYGRWVWHDGRWVIDGGSSAGLMFRPMPPTNNLDDWVPLGVAGLFVGEGSPLNSPGNPPQQFSRDLPNNLKWRFICTSDGTEMTMTAMNIAPDPNRTRMFQKTRKAGDTWDRHWVVVGMHNNMYIAGRNSKFLNPPSPYDRKPFGIDWESAAGLAANDSDFRPRGYRVSHAGLSHRSTLLGQQQGHPDSSRRYPHRIENVAFLNDALQNAVVMDNTSRNISGPGQQNNVYIKLYPKISGHKRMRIVRWLSFNNSLIGRIRFAFYIMAPNVTNAPETPLNMIIPKVVAYLDFSRVTGANVYWDTWGTSQIGRVGIKNGIGFNGGPGRSQTRVHWNFPDGWTQTQMENPAGQVIKIEFEYLPLANIVTVMVSPYFELPTNSIQGSS